MIDLHCHLLPAIDDGPRELHESLQLARMAVENGIQGAVLTPHIHPGRYDNQRNSIIKAVESFRSILIREEIPLRVAAGAEVRISAEILPLIQQGEIPFVGKYQGNEVLLLEMPHSHILPGSEKMVDWLRSRGIVAMIAHPERNKEILRQPDKILPFLSRGCLLQVTAASVSGGFGPQVQACAHYFLRQGWVFALATDAHNADYRPPALYQGYHSAAQVVGDASARRLVDTNPAAISAGLFP